MNQSITQTITVTTAPANSGGTLANTGENLPLFVGVGALCLLVAAALTFIYLKQGRTARAKFRGFFSLIALAGLTGVFIFSQTHAASATATLALTPQNQAISVAQGSQATIPTTATLNTTSTAGYTLTLVQAQSANGVSATVKGGDLTSDTPIAASPVTVKQSSSAATSTAVNTTLTVAATANATPGTSDLKLTYTLTETPVPANPAVCENANPVSACQVDMDAALIPVTYTGTTASPQWSKADVNSEGNWYNYQAKQWANAVAVKAGVRTTYQNAAAGTIIPESDVLGYYTYIPRYQYQVCRPNASDSLTLSAGQCQDGTGADVLSTASPYNFNIKFQTASQTTSYNGTTIGGWATHPAFTFGTAQLNGIWVGKYQTSTSSEANVASETASAAAVTSGDVTIKPNQWGFSNQTVSNQFATAQSFADSTKATYQGMSAGTTDSRMMTNSDWGAVAYLTTSVYGQGAANPVAINNCVAADWNDYNGRTGWSGGSSSASYTQSCAVGTDDSGAYQTTIGQTASTTGNTSGIYDMVGGNWQYVMAHLVNDTNIANYSDNSGFATLPASKYFDGYSTTTFNAAAGDYFGNYQNCTWATCGGQAFFETTSASPVSDWVQSWLGEYSYSVDPYDPWVLRGGLAGDGSDAGLFAALTLDGSAFGGIGFRVVQSRF